MQQQFNTNPRNTDANLVVSFINHAIKNELKSAALGRPIYDDMEICTIRAAGKRDWSPHPATSVSHWEENPDTGEQVPVTYAERFSKQYRQFKEREHQTIQGTPIDYATFLTVGERASLRALNLYTIEQLAQIDGQELKNLGPGGREWKNRAAEYLENAKLSSADTQLRADNEALRARLAVLEEDQERLKAQVASSANGEGEFAEMSDEQVIAFIKSKAGYAPQGNLNRKTLVGMAMEFKSSKAA